MQPHYDIAVIGAGPAGSAAAYFLARAGMHVALLDKSDFPRDKTCGDGLTPRAVQVLAGMGVLPQVEQQAQRCQAVTIRHSDQVTYRLELSNLKDLPQHILVLPRLILDDLLRVHALGAGAEFVPNARVEALTRLPDGTARLELEQGRQLDCRLVILATGSNTALQSSLGLFEKTPTVNLAARTYFEDVEGLDDTTVLFFDGVDHPGYGWVFPTGPRSANVGCGVFCNPLQSQASALRNLIQEHPYLKRILRHARQVGPIKGFPLRTDFSPALCGNDWILVAGEAAGLVNPISGEGIDFALESAQLAAQAILAHWDRGPSATIQRSYRAAMTSKFRYQFVVTHLAQRLYLGEAMIDKFLLRAWRRPHLRQVIMDAVFGSADPVTMFTPHTLWDIFGP